MGIVVYTLPECSECHLLLTFLKTKNIPFQEKLASEHRDFLLRQGFVRVPVLEIDGQLYSGSFRDIILILREKGYLSREKA